MEENESKVYSKVPAKLSPWTNFKNFLFQDVEITTGRSIPKESIQRGT